MELTLSPNARAARWLWAATASLATVCFIALSVSSAQAQDSSAPRQKTESPYFFVKSDTPGVDALPLKSTQVDVQISGVIADVTVTQRYKNEGKTAALLDGRTVVTRAGPVHLAWQAPVSKP